MKGGKMCMLESHFENKATATCLRGETHALLILPEGETHALPILPEGETHALPICYSYMSEGGKTCTPHLAHMS